MSHLLTLMLTTLPFFAVIAIGWFVGRRGVVSEGGVQGLVAFVFFVALPCLLFREVAKSDPATLFDGRFFLAYVVGGLLVFGVAALIARIFFDADAKAIGLHGQAATVGNVGFLAVPLVPGILGAEVLPAVILAWLVDLLIMVPIALGCMEAARGGTAPIKIIGHVARGAFLNPFVISMGLGLVFAIGGFSLPDFADDTVALLARAAGPAALFALGATLSHRPLAGNLGEAGSMAGLKLALHPALVFLAMTILGVDALMVQAATLTAAMPIAANVYLVAEANGVRAGRASSAILISTVLAFLTTSVLAGIVTGAFSGG